MKNPVFPQKGTGYGGPAFDAGMAQRTLFAAMSMQAIRASGKFDSTVETSEEIAEIAEADADALMRRLKL